MGPALETTEARSGTPLSAVSLDLVSRALVDDSPDVVGVFDQEGTILRISRRAAALAGIEPDDAVERSALDYLPAQMQEPLGRLLSGETLVTEHAFGLCAKLDSVSKLDSVWLRARWQPLRDADGQQVGGVLVAEDITAEKNEAHYRHLVELAPIAIMQTTVDGKMMYVSRACAAMFNYATPEEMLDAVNQARVSEVLYVNSAARAEVVEHAQGAHGGWISRRELGRRADGSTFICQLNVCERCDSQSGEPYLFSYLQDVTDEEEARSGLERTAATLEEGERVANMGSWELELPGATLHTSKVWQQMHGLEQETVSIAQLWSLCHPDDAPGLFKEMTRVAKEGGRCQADVRVIRPDTGETRHVAIYGRAERTVDNRIARVRGATLDITDRVLATEALSKKEESLRRALNGAVRALSATVEMRDPYTAGHERRVAELSCAIARRLGRDEEAIEPLFIAASVHDLGKIAVPAEILCKPSRLTSAEFQVIQAHSEVASEILGAIEFDAPIAEIVLQHHERLDGSGYPQGLEGEQIMLDARIIAVADVVEAMISHRPYRPALPVEVVVAEIQEGRGLRYDAHVADACLALLEEGFRFSA